MHNSLGTSLLFRKVIKTGCHTFANALLMTRPICKFHTIVFSSIINPYFMLWVIFPIPDPAMSFKKIHVLIRLAHRHSFNEQINHSDGYNGVIKGFKYDNLHPNGAAIALAMSKKGRQNWQDHLPTTFPPTMFSYQTQNLLETRHLSRIKGLGGGGQTSP